MGGDPDMPTRFGGPPGRPLVVWADARFKRPACPFCALDSALLDAFVHVARRVHQPTTGHTHMKCEQAIRRLTLIRAWIRDAAASPATGRRFDGFIDHLERVMPDLPQIGAGMLILAACASCGWIELGIDDATNHALEVAQEAAAREGPGPLAF